MSGFVYYIEHETRSITPRRLAERGLADRLETNDELSFAAAEVKNGPRPSPGVVVGCKASTPLQRLGYWPDRQVWRAMPGTDGAVWVGYSTEDPPRPDDLKRSTMLNGHWTRLGDGNNWLIPVIRTCRGDEEGIIWINNLPTRSRLDDNGKWVPGGVIDRYEGLWDVTCQWFERLVASLGEPDGSPADDGAAEKTAQKTADETVIDFDYDTIHRTAVKALGVNYRVGDVEADMLGLLDVTGSTSVLNVMTDLELILDLLKKKERRYGSFATTDGDGVCTPATDPASRSCGA